MVTVFIKILQYICYNLFNFMTNFLKKVVLHSSFMCYNCSQRDGGKPLAAVTKLLVS